MQVIRYLPRYAKKEQSNTAIQILGTYLALFIVKIVYIILGNQGRWTS